MSERKQERLRRYRRQKRLAFSAALVPLLALLYFAPWWVTPPCLLFAWMVHEALFSDHQFYSPRGDERYDFPASARQSCTLGTDGRLGASLPEGESTLILEINLCADWKGRFLDPHVLIEGDFSDRQDFERGLKGTRYLNLTGHEEAIRHGRLRMRARHCRLENSAALYVFERPDDSARRLMVIAPHADDAELAAFGLYSRTAETVIVTLTQGEIEADNFRRFGLSQTEAARLKGRLRTWDSLSVPLWGGVPQSRCFQLGYFCLRLAAMRAEPDKAVESLESGEWDIRPARRFNPFVLPADHNGGGEATWNHLVSDLTTLLNHFHPEIIVTPHMGLDPHPDHVHATLAVREAITRSRWKPETLLLYANHLSCNDRWPMGPAEMGVALPPCIDAPPAGTEGGLPSVVMLDAETRRNKALALSLQHDLQTPLPFKLRARRWIQRFWLGRVWPRMGEHEFFRKAVRRHELFWRVAVANHAEMEADGTPLPSDMKERF